MSQFASEAGVPEPIPQRGELDERACLLHRRLGLTSRSTDSSSRRRLHGRVVPLPGELTAAALPGAAGPLAVAFQRCTPPSVHACVPDRAPPRRAVSSADADQRTRTGRHQTPSGRIELDRTSNRRNHRPGRAIPVRALRGGAHVLAQADPHLGGSLNEQPSEDRGAQFPD